MNTLAYWDYIAFWAALVLVAFFVLLAAFVYWCFHQIGEALVATHLHRLDKC